MNSIQSFSSTETILFLAPFVLLLILMAVFPFVPSVSTWWERNKNKAIVSVLGAGASVLLYVLKTHDLSLVGGVYLEYAAFIALTTALFIVSGGIHITGAIAGFPYMNTLFLLTGAILSNYLGTIGASLLLIRPLLRSNRHRKHKTHLFLFFIFIVANCGGLLTPLGDPPLYLGFLHGVPFLWTFRLLPEWALVIGILLFLFHFLDEFYFRKEEAQAKENLAAQVASAHRTLHVEGTLNLILLALIIGIILFSGYVLNPWLERTMGLSAANMGCELFQTVLLFLIALISYHRTPTRIHVENNLHFAPIKEVAILFFGIFGTMVPALAVLENQAQGLNLSGAWQYFWASGLLSGFLDSAPAYVSFTTLAAGHNGLSHDQLGHLARRFPELLAAISCGTVLMGALTYIGNGPNLMVKAIAEHAGVKMPSFGVYLLWSLAVMGPALLLTGYIFF